MSKAAFILAAGEGTRMGPLSDERPKALLPTLDYPQLGWIMAAAQQAGAETVWVNAHSHAEALFDFAHEAGRRLGLEVRTSLEETGPLGTAGALRRLSEDLPETFLVTNSDVATDLSYERLWEAHRSARAEATVLAVPTKTSADFVLEEGWVRELIDRREEHRHGHHYGGVAILNKGLLEYVDEEVCGLYESIFRGLVADHRGFAAYEWGGYWLGVDTPETHLRANLDALAGAYDLRGLGATLGIHIETENHHRFLGEGAVVDEVELRHSVVGRGASVEPGTLLHRCVVWDGARITKGQYQDSVLTGSQTVRVS